MGFPDFGGKNARTFLIAADLPHPSLHPSSCKGLEQLFIDRQRESESRGISKNIGTASASVEVPASHVPPDNASKDDTPRSPIASYEAQAQGRNRPYASFNSIEDFKRIFSVRDETFRKSSDSPHGRFRPPFLPVASKSGMHWPFI